MIAILLASCRSGPPPLATARPDASATGAPTDGPSVTVVAAGDIACDPAAATFRSEGSGACRQRETSDLALSLKPDAVLILGDSQYPWAEGPDYRASYHPSWGRLRSITHPAPGNHEYGQGGRSGADGYFNYFGSAAGARGEGWYSFDLGAWHIIALNSMCRQAGGCEAGSPQGRWLADDLLANAGARCTLAYWHHPRFSSGPHGNNPRTEPLWRALFDAGADIVLSGHDHNYERFAPQTPAGARDDMHGMRQFVVGTGGESVYPVTRIDANSEFHKSGTFGVLVLALGATGYNWRFISEGGTTVDAGSGSCHA